MWPRKMDTFNMPRHESYVQKEVSWLWICQPFYENKITPNSYSRAMNTCDLSMPCLLVLLPWARVSFPALPWEFANVTFKIVDKKKLFKNHILWKFASTVFKHYHQYMTNSQSIHLAFSLPHEHLQTMCFFAHL